MAWIHVLFGGKDRIARASRELIHGSSATSKDDAVVSARVTVGEEPGRVVGGDCRARGWQWAGVDLVRGEIARASGIVAACALPVTAKDDHGVVDALRS